MPLTEEQTKNFEKVLADGMEALLDAILVVRKKNVEPILLTVSRRMPHVLFWYKYALASENQKKILDETEIITEIALPFINFHPKGKNFEIIIVDDVVSSGQTIEYVIQLAKDMSGVDSLSVFVFYADESQFKCRIPNIHISIFYKINNLDEKAALRNFISTIIAATLPIDVTYPLLYVEGAASKLPLNEVKDYVRDPRSKQIENYEVLIDYETGLTSVTKGSIEKGNHNISYTSLLPSEISNSLNNDFAKIRVYDRLGEHIIVPYAPNILSDSDLRNTDLFENKKYKEIWNIVLAHISPEHFYSDKSEKDVSLSMERIENRSYRSLVAMANYLYSLSSFNRIMSVRKEEDILTVRIKAEDLTLIIGSYLTSLIQHLVMQIIAEKLVSPRVHRKITVTDTLIPDSYLPDYEFSKYMVMDEEDLERDLLAILKNAVRQKVKYPSVRMKELEYSIEGIMESFESLYRTLLAKNYEKRIAINRWVDQMIDKGKIVSRYANASASDKSRYWRRFFRLSTSL